ncbi:alpha-2-macroglobulin family protein [Flavobacterium subsaxonicum]|uniref:Membrane protein n=1 Tax=Flavobacterium subsaxonicum WB 4.1-42 = DSM 21790 TaxID=1121898 RepID=A0A0A2MFT5_9FLAO|nr:MG2 domain-containing protein [Flavobacterium subsaxonicum]KGO91552.1 membrane protein [Flavobacterium subsaxonicum WB 4.1-42 = DSM 21790]
MKTLKLVLCLTVITLLLHSCSKPSGKDFDSDFSQFREYITSFSSGIISTKSDIRVGLAFTKKEWQANQELDNNYFSVSPSVDGKVIFLQDNSIAFRPTKKLEADKEYRVTLHLSKFINVPKGLEDFNFRVKTIKQDFLVSVTDLQSYNRNLQYLNATLKASDNLDIAVAKKLVTAQQDGRQLPIRFDANAGTPTEFHFVIDSIQRKAQDSKIKISWNGKPYDIDREGSEEYTVPGKDNFKVITIEPAAGDNQTLLINFSDPIRKDQDFSGLVAVESANNLKYSVDGNLLKVFFPEPLNGSFLVEVFQGIESTEGFKTKNTWSQKVVFEQLAPEVRFIKSGTILPASSNLKLNFEAVNLSKVDVKVYRIFENNVMQFLQDNELNGNYSLRKVALPVAKKTLDLTTNKLLNYGKWNAYAIDLSTLITPQQGAIYRVEITVKKSYSLYKCDASDTDTAAASAQSEDEDEDREDEEDYGDNNEDEYYDYYPYDYDWDQRENPCSSSYFYDRKVSTNVLASDLGVIAKRGENNSYFFAVASITTTQPIAGATVELFTFQQQKVATAQTNAEGIVNLSADDKAYFAIVKKDKNTTYVKLYEGNAQSVSNFDVDGMQLQKGLKGYVYGERGVWRPGDSLFIGFILNDKAAKLPPAHPIKLRLSDPNGKVVFQTVQAYNARNHFKFVVPTQAGAPTGNWEARVSVGGAHFYKSIKIETIKPNRLKIKNSFEGKTIYGSSKNTGTVEVTWLHGAIAKGLKVEMQAKFLKQTTAFKGYLNYIFDDPTQNFSSEEVNIFSGVANDNGVVQVNLEPKLEARAPGMLKAAIITKAYERGGDFSTDVVTATYSPYDTYVGVKLPEGNKYGMLETGKSNKFDLATVNDKGQPKAGRRLDVKVYKVEWRWWWDASHGNTSSYSSALSNTPYYTQQVITDGSGKASFNLKTDEEEWGRYLVRVTDMESGHSTGETVHIDYPYWSGRSRNTTGEEAKMLVFTADKEKYNVGEKATISFPSSEGGRALISLENGSHVVETYWVPTKKGETQLTIPVTAKMAPNVYIYVTLLQPHATTANDSPIRLYGIVPIEVVDKNTLLEPQIAMPAVLKPEQRTNIKVSEKTGKAMTYTLAIVDDGLLDLTRFKTPNAWDAFYAKEALGVRTWDIYDDVIGAYGGKVNQVFSIGGDADLGGGAAKKANRFKPVVIYLGPYTLGKGQTRVHDVKLPMYVGSVRTMVVAANADVSAYGMAEKTTPVRSPLMLLASLPRKVTPKERVTLPVTLFAMENSIKNVTLSIKTNNGFRVVGSSSQVVSFARPDEKIAYFDLEVADITGIGKVTVTATSGKEKASYEVEIDVMNPNPITNNYKELVIESGKSGSIDWNAFGVSGTNKARLEVSSFPSIDFNRRLDYLIQYPHGCLEQTTSGAFPQLYLADIADIDQTRKNKIQKNVTAAINKLAQFQLADGGFAYWQGQPNPDDWGSSYVGHFFIEAEKKGYALPMNAKKQWVQYQQRTARQWRYNDGYHNDFAQAYRLYTLALAGSADLSSMNRLRETNGISNESRLRLAAAYALAGQKNVGQELLAQSAIDYEDNYNYYYYYGSAERNRAMALETLLILGQKEKAFTMAIKLAKQMSSNQWMSTQTTAYCLYAMTKFAQSNGPKGIDISYTNKGKTQAINTPKTFADRVLEIGSSNVVTIKNNKKSTLYVKVVYSGVLPVGQEFAEERGLSTGIVFKDRAGQVINPSSLSQGTEFVAEVTVSNRKGEYVDNVALTQIIPSGWEIVNTRFTDFGSFAENAVDYTDIRDDRTNFYFSLKSNETKTFRILLNASYPGSYYLPGVQCEAMYDNSYLSRTKGQWVKVVR